MIFKKFILLLLFSQLSAQELVKIGIFTSAKLTSIKIFFQDFYSLQYDNNPELFKLNKHQFYQLEIVDDSLILFDNLNNKKIKAKSLNFFSQDINQSMFTIISNNSYKKERTYKGHLNVSVSSKKLKLINTLELENYVSSVVYAEVGKRRHPEFYKAQAVLVRTYALSHLYKHLSEGFNLCDEVHCQVYYGDAQSQTILNAIQSTHNEVIVDKDLNLIIAAFHSNSGGQTVNSEDIWGNKKEYLRSIIDTFSIGMPSYYWKKKLSLQEWLMYLKKYNYPIKDSNALNYALNFKQPERKIYLQYNSTKIPLKNIRDELHLMSTFFDIQVNPTKDTVIFSGKGFGHGVGLSQEGAMKMATMGFNYKDIIKFYYQDIILIDLKKLNFFKEE